MNLIKQIDAPLKKKLCIDAFFLSFPQKYTKNFAFSFNKFAIPSIIFYLEINARHQGGLSVARLDDGQRGPSHEVIHDYVPVRTLIGSLLRLHAKLQVPSDLCPQYWLISAGCLLHFKWIYCRRNWWINFLSEIKKSTCLASSDEDDDDEEEEECF